MAVQWLIDKGYDVVACCLDVGEGKDLDIVYKKALDMEQLNVILLMQQKNLVMSM